MTEKLSLFRPAKHKSTKIIMDILFIFSGNAIVKSTAASAKINIISANLLDLKILVNELLGINVAADV